MAPDDHDSDSNQIQPLISETPDFIMSSDGESPAPGPPPPRIAARIYKSRTQRKSSAASSRRNSITSHVSSRSNKSAHGGPRSTHVAQHLRRASIIESRRAKAADWNAHAEKVRLRAALNKAAPRTTADSEERALAAQQAREKVLAQVKANCAAEVKRSKKVAEEQREKRAAEHLKLKEDLEERHAQAERRKALLEQSLRRPRTATQSGSAGREAGYIWKPRNELEAAKVIQRAWRTKLHRRIIQDFLDLGLTVETVQKASFEDVGERLNEDEVIQRTGRLLRVFGLNGDSDDDDETDEKSAARTFLSTFLILGQQEQVLSHDGEQEQDLIAKAKDLLFVMNKILESFPECVPDQKTTATAELAASHSAFRAAFTAWRSQDSSFMIKNMVAQFAELDAIWVSVKDDTSGEVAADYREGIRQNQALVLVKLKKLAGPDRAMKLIKDAIKKNRKAKAQKKAKQDSKPRIVNTKAIEEANAESFNAVESLSTAPEPQATSDSAQAVRSAFKSSSLVPASRNVVHELAINGEWKIDIEPTESKKDEMVQNFARELRAGLDDGLADIWIPALAESIRDKLGSVLAPGKPTHNMVTEVLDPDLIAQQVRANAFSYQKFFDFMNSLLPSLCAPVRDPEVKALAQNPSDEPVVQMARIFYVIELLVLDMLNFQLMTVAPTLLKESTGYEARAFDKEMAGRSPEKTVEWWRQASAAAQEDANRRTGNAETASAVSTPSVSAAKVYMYGLVDLATGTEALTEDDLPETLSLDVRRMARLRADILRIITVAAILLNAKNLLRRDTRSLWKAEAARMWDLLPDGNTQNFSASRSPVPAASVFVSIIESRYALPPSTKQQLTTFITRILAEYSALTNLPNSSASPSTPSRPSSSASSSTPRPSTRPSSSSGPSTSTPKPSPTKETTTLHHPVLKILHKKLRSHILARLTASSADERARLSNTNTNESSIATTVASPSAIATSGSSELGTAGMAEFVSRVSEMVDELGRVGRVDREAHEGVYERIIQRIAASHDSDEPEAKK